MGIWKNVEELEMYLSLPELEHIIIKAREDKHNHQKFLASLQGIDLDAISKESVEDRVEASKRRAAAVLAGKSIEEVEFDEFDLGYEVEE